MNQRRLSKKRTERERLSVDLTPHEDLRQMLACAEHAGLVRSTLTVKALRLWLIEHGYGRPAKGASVRVSEL
jgi:hypothetical protein